jgi:hypothetical protein
MGHEDDILDTTVDTGMEVNIDPDRELDAVLGDLEALLKSGEVIGALTLRGINGSLALVAAGALRAYLAGKKAEAADDFVTVGEEIRGRIEAGHEGGGPRGRRPS